MSKYLIRQNFLKLRADLKADVRETAAINVAKHCSQIAIFQASTHITCYLPFREELNTAPIIESIWHSNKNCYLPVLTKEKTLIFVKYHYGDSLVKNRFGIYEPKIQQDVLAAAQLDLVLMPLIAFDRQGVRLGTGGGYYDKTFAFLLSAEGQKIIPKPHMVGVGFAIQESKTPLPRDPWDITMEAVVTEDGVIHCGGGA